MALEDFTEMPLDKAWKVITEAVDYRMESYGPITRDEARPEQYELGWALGHIATAMAQSRKSLNEVEDSVLYAEIARRAMPELGQFKFKGNFGPYVINRAEAGPKPGTEVEFEGEYVKAPRYKVGDEVWIHIRGGIELEGRVLRAYSMGYQSYYCVKLKDNSAHNNVEEYDLRLRNATI